MPQLGDLTTSAATVTEADTMLRVLNTDQKRMSTQLYYILALSIDSDASALTIVERAGRRRTAGVVAASSGF